VAKGGGKVGRRLRRVSLAAGLAAALMAPQIRAEEGSKQPPDVRMQQVEIRGEVERPDVFYIIPRRQVQLNLSPRSKDFGAEIMEPLLPGAFEEWVRNRRGEKAK